MKGYHFYAEYKTPADKRNGTHTGNCIALYHGEGIESDEIVFCLRLHLSVLAPLCSYANSPVCWCTANRETLRRNHKRVSEKEARAIHPELFARLDGEDS